MGKATKPRGSSNAGRPAQRGERYACGKLKPAKPHVVDYLTRAAHDYNPLGLATEMGFVRSHLHRAGEGFARIYRRTGYTGSRVTGSGLHEVEERPEWRAALSTMPDAELVAAFDRVFNVFGDDGERRTEARKQWKAINKRLTPAERSELISVCIVGDTPFWLLHMAQGRELNDKWLARSEMFLSGLRKVCAWFMEQREVPTVVQLPPRQKTPGPKVIDRTEYVNEAGELLFVAERKISRRSA